MPTWLRISILLLATLTTFVDIFPDRVKAKNLIQGLVVSIKILIAIGLLAIAIIDYYEAKEEKEIAATTGQMAKRTSSIIYPKLLIDETGSISSSDPKNGIQFANGDGLPIIQVRIDNGQLKVDANLRGQDGKVIATVKDLRWKIYDKGYQYNNDENGFELITIEGKVVFQVDVVRDDAVRVFGCFFNGPCIGTQPSRPLFKYPREDYLGVRLKVDG